MPALGLSAPAAAPPTIVSVGDPIRQRRHGPAEQRRHARCGNPARFRRLRITARCCCKSGAALVEIAAAAAPPKSDLLKYSEAHHILRSCRPSTTSRSARWVGRNAFHSSTPSLPGS